MTNQQLLQIRLKNQQLSKHLFSTVGDLVEWMGAVQAQDYLGALWSVGMRLNGQREDMVEKALADKEIIRTWPMRGTLHFVAPRDVRWMLEHLARKVYSKVGSVYRREGLDTKQFTRAMTIWEKALSGNIALTRDEMYAKLERAKLSTKGSRGLLMLGYAAQDGLICFGSRNGKQQTFVLLDEWITSHKSMLSQEEALRRLAEIYVRSHGPVMVEDLAWWSGLTKTEATTALNSLGKDLLKTNLNGKSYWFFEKDASQKLSKQSFAALLPTYDEYVIAYKDRGPITQSSDPKQAGGSFASAIVHNGQVTGIWRRELFKDRVAIELKPFATYSSTQQKLLSKEIRRYSTYLNLPFMQA